MIAALKDAARIVAGWNTERQWIEIQVTDDGIALLGRAATDDVGYTLVQQIDWGRMDIEPQIVPSSVERMARQLESRCRHVPVARIAPRTEQLPVRAIPLEDWPMIVMVGLIMLVCIPLGGGLL